MSLQMPENLPSPEFSQNAEVVLAKRYRRWDASGEHQESTRDVLACGVGHRRRRGKVRKIPLHA